MPATFLASTNNSLGPGLGTREVIMVNKTTTAVVAGEPTQWALQTATGYTSYIQGVSTSAFGAVIAAVAGAGDLAGIGAAAATFVAKDAIAADGDTGLFYMYGPNVPIILTAVTNDKDLGTLYGTAAAAATLHDVVDGTVLRTVASAQAALTAAAGATLVTCTFNGWNGLGR